MPKGYTELPVEVSAAPLDRMRCGLRVGSKLRLIPLNRKPTVTPASKATETIPFALRDIAVSGETTLGNVQLVFGLQHGTDWDDYLRESAKAGGVNIELDFRILGSLLFTAPATARFLVAVLAAGAGQQAGLSEITGGANLEAPGWRIGRDIKRGSVLELTETPDDDTKRLADLTVVSHLLYENEDGDNAKIYSKGLVAAIAAAGPFTVRDQSVNWIYSGELLTYNDQFDERLGLVAIELSQEDAVADRSLIRSEDVEAASLFYT